MKKKQFKYEKSTQTIRTVPENYCVCKLETFAFGGFTDAALMASFGSIDKLGEYLVNKLNK